MPILCDERYHNHPSFLSENEYMDDTSYIWVLSPIAVLLVVLLGATFALGSWKGSVDKALGTLHKVIHRLEKRMSRLEKKIDAIPMPAIARGSPLRLTEFGERLSKEIGAKRWAETLAPSLMEECDGKLAYDVQELCIEYAKAKLQLSTEDEAKVKKCAFENGIDVETIRKVLGLELCYVVLSSAGIAH